MNISKLIAKGRVQPITKTDGEGTEWLVGYRRKASSRKSGDYWPIKLAEHPVQFANDNEVRGVAFINEIGEIRDGWGMLAPYGDYPGQAIMAQPDGTFKKVPAIQRIDQAAVDGMVKRFNSVWQRAKRYVTGCPVYDGHPDVPTIANEYPDDSEKGTIIDLEARGGGLFCKAVFTNEGAALIETKKRRAFSGYWDADPIGEENGVKIFRPTKLISAALTNRPNLPVQLLNEKETNNQKENIMKKTVVIEFLAAHGITIANDATEEQVSEALKQLGEKAKTATASVATLTQEKATLANEKETLKGEVATLKSDKTTLTTDLATANTKFANARKAHVADLVGTALATGRITAAEKPTWETRLGNEATFANESAAIVALKPTVKTESATLQIGNRQVSIANAAERREVVNGLVEEEMKTNGGNYDRAYASVQRKHSALFDVMKKPKAD